MCYGWGGGLRPTLGVALLVPIAGCHCTGTDKFGGVVPLLPLLCAVVEGGGRRPTLGEWCHCWVPLQLGRGEGDDQLWGSGRGAIAGCPYAAMASRQTALNFLQTLHCSLR